MLCLDGSVSIDECDVFCFIVVLIGLLNLLYMINVYLKFVVEVGDLKGMWIV